MPAGPVVCLTHVAPKQIYWRLFLYEFYIAHVKCNMKSVA